ncbi:hypothetical protein HGRIS_002533 [Hohenbuehelia grisea]|uniref:Xylanolytic transcriptional activator regulatory domain-containing protein n=1 Tax=Hohenbuehelia grisea TaxID=104357 RepID=A0ABR3JKX4_9AGAR
MSDKKRTVKGPNYVEELEAQVKKLKGMLLKVRHERYLTDCLFDPHLLVIVKLDPNALQDDEELDVYSPDSSHSNLKERSPSVPSTLPRIPIPLPADSPDTKDIVVEGDHEHVKLAESMHNLSLHRAGDRFFGKSSGFMLLHAAIKVKRDYAGQQQTEIKPVEFKRPEIWNLEPWEADAITKDEMFDYVFPDDDLLDDLIDIFFEKINLYIPLLHRASFERLVEEGLHLQDRWFASVLLAVCALASRYSDDPRVMMGGSELSSGWRWFSQIQVLRQSFLNIPSLFELQFYALAVVYYHGSSNPQASWVMIGLGIRYAQEVGAHRRKDKERGPTVHGELLKRAVWLLLLMDRMVSSFVGRPCAIQDEDFDLDLPIEVDDEYWEHSDPKQAFTQPPGKPCRVTAFILALKLCEVLASALRTIYSTNVTKLFAGLATPNWEQRIVSELDSVLNKWVDSVPDYLRWDPVREDPVFFHLSANIFSMYYYTQILVHRPFITAVQGSTSLSFASLAICTNSARACCHLLDTQRRRGPLSPLPTTQASLIL